MGHFIYLYRILVSANTDKVSLTVPQAAKTLGIKWRRAGHLQNNWIPKVLSFGLFLTSLNINMGGNVIDLLVSLSQAARSPGRHVDIRSPAKQLECSKSV
jgi:hypothetical protein